MSEQTRAVLKVFGINVTKFEEAVQSLEASPTADNMRNYVDAQSQLLESFVQLMNVVSELMSRGASASRRASTAGG
ncbi:MAG: hypothetical protein RMI43_06255 [Candidatus Caldarchaeum sp.]|nr:hypothetical protein [Candidatus Caldarchaeum sp.]MCX8200864.1 hypothetical protein [Candidatus Caldarchaeum sp.]MDW8063755.1 hypothetical protein [Candidatus Caldarchaeum sp.]MDW8434813.1 hypothetical protein [Candidatus Caldarchaeum sp.]